MVTLGRISRISTRRAYVVVDTDDGERVHETQDAGFYDPPPSPGDLLIRLADGTLSHRPPDISRSMFSALAASTKQKYACRVGGNMPLDPRSDDEITKAKAKPLMSQPAKYGSKPADPNRQSVGDAIKRMGW